MNKAVGKAFYNNKAYAFIFLFILFFLLHINSTLDTNDTIIFTTMKKFA